MKPINAKRHQVRVINKDGSEIIDDLNLNTNKYNNNNNNYNLMSNHSAHSTPWGHTTGVGSSGGGGVGGRGEQLHTPIGGNTHKSGSYGGGLTTPHFTNDNINLDEPSLQRKSYRKSHRNGGGLRNMVKNRSKYSNHTNMSDPRYGGLTGNPKKTFENLNHSLRNENNKDINLMIHGGMNVRRNNEFTNHSLRAQTPQIGIQTPAYGMHLNEDEIENDNRNDNMFGARTPAIGMGLDTGIGE